MTGTPSRRGWPEQTIGIVSPLLLLVAWEAASAAGLLRPQFFPRPTLILGHALDLALDGSLGRHAGITTARVAAAFALATSVSALASGKDIVDTAVQAGQFKTLALAYRRTFTFDLDAHREQA